MGQNNGNMTKKDSPQWTLLCTIPDRWEAHFIRGRLQAAGIPTHVVTEAAAELYGITYGPLAATKLFVPQKSLAQARSVLTSFVPPVKEGPCKGSNKPYEPDGE